MVTAEFGGLNDCPGRGPYRVGSYGALLARKQGRSNAILVSFSDVHRAFGIAVPVPEWTEAGI